MRRAAASIATLAAGAMMFTFAAGPALAAPHCTNAADRDMFDVTALKSRLMVLATGCGDHDGYNAFMTRYHPELEHTDRALMDYFKHHYGRAGQKQYDAYITALANGESDVGISEGSDFCPHDAMMFKEVMALPASTDLPAYAAGKNLVPVSLGACTAPEPQVEHKAPAHHTTPARKGKKK